MVLVDASMKLVRALTRHEFDLGRSHRTARCLWRGRRDGDFLDRIEAGRNPRKETIRGLVVIILDVDAVERDIDRALRQSVDRCIPSDTWRVDTGHLD